MQLVWEILGAILAANDFLKGFVLSLIAIVWDAALAVLIVIGLIRMWDKIRMFYAGPKMNWSIGDDNNKAFAARLLLAVVALACLFYAAHLYSQL